MAYIKTGDDGNEEEKKLDICAHKPKRGQKKPIR